MKKAILGKKVGMTQLFREDGTMIPVTVVLAGPCPVTQIKTIDRDGYKAVQMAFQPVREKLITRPQMGHLRKAGVEAHKYVKEPLLRGGLPQQSCRHRFPGYSPQNPWFLSRSHGKRLSRPAI